VTGVSGLKQLKEHTYYMRSAKLVVVTSGSNVILVNERGVVIEHPTPHASQWSVLMQRLSDPLSGTAVRDLAASLPDLNDQLWRRLLDGGHVLEAQEKETLLGFRDCVLSDNQGYHLVPSEPVCENLILACTGSIVSGLMAPTILSLCYSGFQRELDVILTESARKFVTPDLLESYGIRTWTNAFERREKINVPHVQLARSADCVLVMPATANSLHRMAEAACTDLLSMIVAATTAPVVLAPAMNDAMWNNRGIQRNVRRLRRDGMYVIEPTLIFGAADFTTRGGVMYGGHGTLWAGPGSLMRALSAVLHVAGRLASQHINDV